MASKKTTKKNQKKSSVAKNILVSILALIIGILAGFVVSNSYFTYNLEFELVGKTHQKVALGTEYSEQGVVCKFQNIDYSLDVVKTYYDENKEECETIDTSVLKSYYVEYKIDNEKFSSKLTRLVTIVEVEDLEINFVMLDGKYAGDCIYIKAGDTDILVDAGAKASDASGIKAYLTDDEAGWHSYVEDGKIEYLIVTHAHEDHIAALTGNSTYEGLLTQFEFETIIDFPKTLVTSKTYERYERQVSDLVSNGTTRYNALECYNNENGASRIIEVAVGIEIEILYNYFYDHDAEEENENSVCFMLRRWEEQYLFTGDLEAEGEEYLLEYNDLGEVYLYKLGHHGSYSSSTDKLISAIKPKVAVATCAAFTNQYTQNQDNTFPASKTVNTLVNNGVEHLYVSKMLANGATEFSEQEVEPANGHIVVTATSTGTTIYCSAEQKDFFEFETFKYYRTWKSLYD